MENGTQPAAAGGHWVAAAPPNFRDRVVKQIMRNLPQVLKGRQVDDLALRHAASGYEAAVFNQSNNTQDYLRTISMKMLCLERKRRPVVQAAPDHQQQALMGHQMQPLNAVLPNSSAAPMSWTASTIPLTVRPPQVQNMHIKVNQALPSFTTPVAQVAPLQWHHAPPNTTSTTPVAPVTGDMEPFMGGACSKQIQQENPRDEAIPQLTQNVDLPGTATAELEAEAEAETPVAVEAAKTSALCSLASDMGANLKRAFCHTTSGTMDGSSCVWSDNESSEESCYKRRKAQDGSLLDEIRAACSMLIGTNISISKEDAGDVSGTVIELCYNAVSLAPDLRAVIGASDIKTKLLVPDDYPWSSPVIHVSNGGPRSGLPGAVEVAFRHALGLLPEPRSIKRITEVWDSVARRVVSQFAYRLCGGTFDTRSEDYVYMLLSKFNRQVEELSCT